MMLEILRTKETKGIIESAPQWVQLAEPKNFYVSANRRVQSRELTLNDLRSLVYNPQASGRGGDAEFDTELIYSSERWPSISHSFERTWQIWFSKLQ